MKKIITTLIVVVMTVACLFAFAACGNNETEKKVEIGVQSGNTAEYYVNGDEDWGFAGYENLEAKQYDSAYLAIQDMKNGGIDYVMTDIAPANALAAKIDGVKVIDIELTEEEYAFGVDKSNATLLADVNAQIAAMKTNGKLAEIAGNYFSDSYLPEGIVSATQDASKKDTQLVVATNAEFPPFEYKDGNKFVGIDMEICAYIAEQLNMELVIIDMDFDSVVTSVGTNDIDIAAAGLTVSDARKESVNFATSYYEASQVMIVNNSNTAFDKCESVTDVENVLKGLK